MWEKISTFNFMFPFQPHNNCTWHKYPIGTVGVHRLIHTYFKTHVLVPYQLRRLLEVQENWSHASKRIFLYHLGFVLKMCNNQAFHFYKRILQCQGSRDGIVVEHSPPTNVAQVRFPDSASYVGWVFWFSTLLREVFSGYSGFPLSSKTNIWFDLSRFDLISRMYCKAHLIICVC